MKRIIFINWKWERKKTMPIFNSFLEDEPEQAWKTFLANLDNLWLWDRVGEGSDETVPILDESNVNAYILPVKIDIQNLKNPDSAKSTFIKKVSEYLDKKFAKEYELLFMFHKGDGFDEILSLGSSYDTYIRFKLFGGGSDPIYGKNALLDSGLCNYTFTRQSKSAWFGKPDKSGGTKPVLAVKQQFFDKVWNSYWYSTKKKMKDLRIKIMDRQVPDFPDNYVSEVQNLTKSMLLAFSPKKYEHFKLPKDFHDDKGFSNCKDLIGLIEAFEDKKIWLEQLVLFAENGKLDQYDLLNQSFSKLITSWNTK